MISRTIAIIIFCGLVVLVVVQAVYYYPLLPNMMASSFGPGGQARAWTSKSAFMGVYASVVGVITLIFPAILLVTQKIPVRMINLPNKDYWLAPQRRADTYRSFSSSMMWFGNATLLFILVWMEAMFRTNLQPAWNPSTAFLVTSGSYLAWTLIWTGILLYGFRLPREDPFTE